jgi:5-methylcytosine-specific restriction endonuclease McrA
MAKKKIKVQIDGLGPEDLKRIHKAVRQVWSWSYPRRLAKKRALHEDGFYRCELPSCPDKGKPQPNISVDHINPIGEVGGTEYVKKMWCPSDQLQCLCKKCHAKKTREEKKAKR